MRIRRDVVFVSSVLFTVALLWMVPVCSGLALSGRHRRVLEGLDACCQGELYTTGHLGEATMALIFVGLIVTWTGYVKGVRSAWFVMFIIVWVWAFPLLLFSWSIPDIRGTPFPESISRAYTPPPSASDWLFGLEHFTPMVIALILPIRSFFWSSKTAGT